MKKLLIISGPTATGKTALAVKLAQKFNGEIISADSRQIYRGMDIGTGKDHPKNIKIHLIDLINPDESFSVSQYKKLALEKISEIQAQNKLPILVGGSGFYIDSVINSAYDTFSVKPNILLRVVLNRLPLSVLKIILKIIDKNIYFKLNNSDINNPRRLIRKIEISLSKDARSDVFTNNINFLHLSLLTPRQTLYDRIDARVKNRLKMGLIDEIKNLLKKYKWSDPGLKTIAYINFKKYFSLGTSLADAQQKWTFAEHALARRQLTWFKNAKVDHYFNITSANFQKNASKIVAQWYNKL
jgi:tRNA dimethylallyltransferase